MKKELVGESIYNKQSLKTKIKFYDDDTIHFQDQQIPIVGSNYTCLEAILINFLKKDKNYYPQGFLEERKKLKKKS